MGYINANKISLNVQETELLIFAHKRKILEHEVEVNLNRKRLYLTPSVKCLGKNDENFKQCPYINNLAAKLNRLNTLLIKVRNYVSLEILRSIY